MAKVEIVLNDGPRGTVVKIDGVTIDRVRKVTVVHEVDSYPTVTVEALLDTDSIVTGEAMVRMIAKV